MTYKICYWDSELQQQLERDATLEEVSEIEKRKIDSIQLDIINANASIKLALKQIDERSIRALREGDTSRLASLELEASNLRSTLQDE